MSENIKKSFLENRINEKAKERFEIDLQKTVKLLNDDPILQNLKIRALGLSGSWEERGEFIFHKNVSAIGKTMLDNTNMIEVKDSLIKKYMLEETDNLLDKISCLEDYFNNR